jgi:ATP-dependent RNA helicase DeaD
MASMATRPILGFPQLGLAAAVLRAVDAVGYETPTAIQAVAIPPLLERRDLVGQAQTGTGKTAAFALPILSLLDASRAQPQALVLTPTRELAIQVAEAMQTYARYLKGFHVVPVYGGQDVEIQLRKLRRGVHVVVGTPGRIRDHLRRGTLELDALATVVLDEADEMLRMGFLEEVEQILDHTPAEKQVALFSATMPEPIRRVARKYLRDPVEIHIETPTATVASVSQSYLQVHGSEKLDALTRILEVEDFDAMLVFVRTRIATAELAEKLEARGFASAPLSGDVSQSLRERTVDRLKKGRIDILVATDVAARGLDVDRISHVVNYDVPYDVESYVHRIGRTARAGREGRAILFVSPRERRMLAAIERLTRQPIEPMRLPSREDVVNRRVAQLEQTIAETIAAQDLDRFEEWVESYRKDGGQTLEKIAAALAFLVQRGKPLEAPAAAAEPRATARRGPVPKPPPRSAPPGRRRAESGRRPARETVEKVPMQLFRIEVGRDHGVEPGNIVGAITNEAQLDGRYVGRIKIFDTFSLVDLPAGMPHEIVEHLKKVRLGGRPLRIRRDDGGSDEPGKGRRPPPAHKPPAHKKRAPKKKRLTHKQKLKLEKKRGLPKSKGSPTKKG